MWAFVLICLAILLCVEYRRRTFRVFKELGIPGPEPNIFFGNILEILQKTPIKCHQEWIEKYGNIVGYYYGIKPEVLIADADILKRIQISEFHNFINRPSVTCTIRQKQNKSVPKRQVGFSQQLVSLRDKRWKEIRSIITPSFTASKMKIMVPIMDDAVNSLVKNVDAECKSGESFNIYPLYQRLTMDVIGRTAFGIHTDVQNNPNDPFLRSSRVLFSGETNIPLLVLTASFPRLQMVWTWLSRLRLRFKNKGISPIIELINSVNAVIATRRENPENRRPDLLQLIIDAEVDGNAKVTKDDLTAKVDNEAPEEQKTPISSSNKLVCKMTDDDILDNSVLFFLAGYETTSTALAFVTHFLLKHPEVQDRVRKEIQDAIGSEGELNYTSITRLQYLDQVINESLRLYPPVYLFVTRECGEDMDFGSFRLKKGISIQTSVYTMQRDPNLWENPTEFIPERFAPENKANIHPMAFQVFGNGPRNCVGMRFAQMEIKLALSKLLAKYKLVACAETEQDPLNLKISTAMLTPKNGIWVKVVPVKE